MADGMENAPDCIIPSLPPFLGIAPLVHDPVAGDGQVWPLGSTGTAAAQAMTPQPPQRIIMPAGSAISSITNATMMAASSPGAANEADDTPKKGNPVKRKFPDFSRAFSQDNALLRGQIGCRTTDRRWDDGRRHITVSVGAVVAAVAAEDYY